MTDMHSPENDSPAPNEFGGNRAPPDSGALNAQPVQQPAPYDPPVVHDPPVVSQPRLSEEDAPFSEFSQWIEDTLGSESYGAPRVFDLYTLLAVTLAFALMFAVLRLIEPLLQNALPQVALALGAFVTLTAIAQLALWKGKKPRIASIVAGPAVWFVVAMGFAFQNPQELMNPLILIGLICSSILGVLAGYLGGAMVAGVFLLADVFRKRFIKKKLPVVPSNDDAIFESDQ